MANDDLAMLTIHMDRKCTSCGQKGATDGGLCLECVSKLAALKKLTGGSKA